MTKQMPTEAQEQQKLVYWLRIKHIPHFAPTNENNTYKQDRKYAMIAEAKAKATGKLKGVSDLVVMLPKKILFIEMKRRKKKLKNGDYSISHTKVSKEQYEFLTTVNRYGYAEGRVCYGFEEARGFILENMDG